MRTNCQWRRQEGDWGVQCTRGQTHYRDPGSSCFLIRNKCNSVIICQSLCNANTASRMKPANFVRVATHLGAVSYAAPGHASASDATANCQYVLQQGKGTNATTTDFTQMNAFRGQHILLAIQHVISSQTLRSWQRFGVLWMALSQAYMASCKYVK